MRRLLKEIAPSEKRRWNFLNQMQMIDFKEKPKSEIAKEMKIYLREKVLPYWYDTTVDLRNGGYVLSDKLDSSPNAGNPWLRRLLSSLSSTFHIHAHKAREKQLVSQSRLILVFSLAHRLGYSDAKRNYLKAAEVGYLFLIEYMLDKKYGGFFWKTDLRGRAVDLCKSLYGQAFALYALVEYHRASGLSAPLAQAVALYEKVQEMFYDKINSGWIEHGEADFRPLRLNNKSLLYPRSMPDMLGFKSGNAHLHWMESLAELYDVTANASVRSLLMEALHINKTYFFPVDASKYCEYRRADWGEVKGNRHEGICYGHNVEFAWLMIHAQEVLQIPPDWDHFFSILDHALKYGFDHKRGGFYFKGFDEQPASKTEKIWWVQAEGLAALADALRHEAAAEYRRALALLLNWIFRHQILSDDGIWISSTDEEGNPLNLTKAGHWKAAYHEVRAITKFIHVFSCNNTKP